LVRAHLCAAQAALHHGGNLHLLTALVHVITRVPRHETRSARDFTVNFGPVHPAAHGVLRLLLELDGEVVTPRRSHVGFLHRGTEKLIENKTYMQALPYFDRLDYVAPMNQEHAFCLAAERLLGWSSKASAAHPRALLRDRPASLHLLNVTTQASDIGALTPNLWGFEEREKLMVFYERARARACTPTISVLAASSGSAPKASRGHLRVLRPILESL